MDAFDQRDRNVFAEWFRWLRGAGVLAMVLLGVARASPVGKVTVWGRQVVFPQGGYGATFTRVAAGANHNLALKRDGTVIAWGANWYGQCAVPTG